MIFETKTCGGCRSCEMACSHHHKAVFQPSISSIQILDRTKELGFALSLSGQSEDGRIACDRCQGLDEPLCVKYCNYPDELKEILKKFWETQESK
ncbi:hypothetical protein ES703_120780 [subsurface metagenome]